jgi:hypothetical protein
MPSTRIQPDPYGKSPARKKIFIFDTTLRDGEQSAGAGMMPKEKLIFLMRQSFGISSGNR